MSKNKYSRFTICKKCIHNFGDGCEAYNDDFLEITSEDECDDFDDGYLPPNPECNIDEDE